MLTAYQAETVAFIGDGLVVCYDCGHKRLDQGGGDADGLAPYSRYSVDEEWAEDGLECEDCRGEIVEPMSPHDRLEYGVDDIETHAEDFHETHAEDFRAGAEEAHIDDAEDQNEALKAWHEDLPDHDHQS